MVKHKTPGSMVLIGSMSGLNANKGFTSSVYNSSKAAVIQLGRNLAMEAFIHGVLDDAELAAQSAVVASLRLDR